MFIVLKIQWSLIFKYLLSIYKKNQIKYFLVWVSQQYLADISRTLTRHRGQYSATIQTRVSLHRFVTTEHRCDR